MTFAEENTRQLTAEEHHRSRLPQLLPPAILPVGLAAVLQPASTASSALSWICFITGLL